MFDWKSNVYLPIGKFLDKGIFLPFNRTVSKFYCHVLTPLIGQVVKTQLKKPFRILARQSAKSGVGFNPLFSDLDIAFVFGNSAERSDYSVARRAIFNLKRMLPFLGELEIFNDEEWNRRQNLIDKNQIPFQLIRDIRKTYWLYLDLGQLKSPYHKHKVRRALLRLHPGGDGSPASTLRFLLKQLSPLISGEFLKNPYLNRIDLSDLTQKLSIDHLGWPIEILTESSPSLYEIWWLAAVTPCEGRNSNVNEILLAVRRSFLFQIYIDYLEAEWLQIKAVYRARPDEFPWMDQWQAILLTRLNQTGSWFENSNFSKKSPGELYSAPERNSM